MRFRDTRASQESAARRGREDQAKRLKDEIPDAEVLNLEIGERRAGQTAAENVYIRRVVVASAPALFEIPCGDKACVDGGHDLTHPIMGGLKKRLESFDGEDSCNGSVGDATCGRIVRFSAKVQYKKKSEPDAG